MPVARQTRPATKNHAAKNTVATANLLRMRRSMVLLPGRARWSGSRKGVRSSIAYRTSIAATTRTNIAIRLIFDLL